MLAEIILLGLVPLLLTKKILKKIKKNSKNKRIIF
tara:strand:+ start:42 stop:146 length:105 start_codon:yes stop_codon:yes gene_type:complete